MILKHQAQPSWWRNYSFPCIYVVLYLSKNSQGLSHPRRWKRLPRHSVHEHTWFMQQFSLLICAGLLHSQPGRTKGFWYGYGIAALTIAENQLPKRQHLAVCSLKQCALWHLMPYFWTVVKVFLQRQSPSAKPIGSKHMGACEDPAGFLSTSAEVLDSDLKTPGGQVNTLC